MNDARPEGTSNITASPDREEQSSVVGGADSVSETAASDRRLEDLIALHGRALYRLALAITRSNALAEEVVQETLLVAWRSMPPMDLQGETRWIRRVARNRAISVVRHESHSVTSSDWEFLVAGGPDTERVVEGRHLLSRMLEALADLDETARAMLILRETEELTYVELADLFGLTASAVKARLYRARHQLKTTLRDWEV